MKEKFDVIGMTCSSCSSNIEKTVRKLKGVSIANVNLLSNTMMVEYKETMLSTDQIIRTVEDIGYSITVANENQKKKIENNAREDEMKSMKKRLLISVVFLIPIMYIAMYHMLESWFHLSTPQMIKNIFSGTENSMTFVFTQFILLLPIIFANQKYFKVGFKALWKRKPNMDSLIALGSSAAILYGIFAIYGIGYGLGHGNLELVHQYSMDIYFESAATILTLITVRKILRNKIKR